MAADPQLQRQTLHYPWAQTVDLKSDPKQGKGLNRLENAEILRTGEIRKRKGLRKYTQNRTVRSDAYRTAGGVITKGIAVVPFQKDKLAVLGQDTNLRTLNGDPGIGYPDAGEAFFAPLTQEISLLPSDQVTWRAMSEHSHFSAEGIKGATRGLAGSFGSSTSRTQVAESSRHRAFAYILRGETAPRVDVVDKISGAPVVLGVQIASMQAPFWMVMAHRSSNAPRFVVVGDDTSGANQIRLVPIVPETGALESAALITDANITTTDGDVNVAPSLGAHSGAIPPANELLGRRPRAVLIASRTAAGNLRLTQVFPTGGVFTTDFNVDTGSAITAACAVCYLEQSDASASYRIAVLTKSTNDYALRIYDNNGALVVASVAFATDTSTGAGRSIVGGHRNVVDVGDQSATADYSIQCFANSYTSSAALNEFWQQLKIYSFILTSAPALTAVQTTFEPNVHVYAHPFIFNRKVYVPAAYQHAHAHKTPERLTQSQLWLLALRSNGMAAGAPETFVAGRLLAIDLGDPAHYSSSGKNLPICQIIDTAVLIPCERQLRIIGSGVYGSVIADVTTAAVLVNFASAPPQWVRSNNDVIVSGACIVALTTQADELGFYHAPALGTFVKLAAGGSLGAGNYDYSALYEWTDGFGQRHKSAPAATRSTSDDAQNPAANDRMTIRVSTLPQMSHLGGNSDAATAHDPQFSDKMMRSEIVLYRTEVGLSTHRRLSGSDLAATVNVPNANFIDIIDGISDVSTQDDEVLYIDGDELPNDAPPGSSIILAHKNRVFIVPDEDPTSLWPSKSRLPGVGLSFNADSAMPLPVKCTGLGGMDDYVVVFGQSTTHIFSGEGPTSTGIGAFSQLQEISKTIGCRDRNSVVSIPQGLMFKSLNGWYLLDRSLQLHYIGALVEPYNPYTIFAAVAVEGKNQLRIVHDPSQTTDMLMFDYSNLVTPMPKGEGPFVWGVMKSDQVIPQHAASIGGKLYILDRNGTLYVEDSADFKDNDQPFRFRATTSAIQLNDITGLMKCWWVHVVGEMSKTTVPLKLKIYYDYEDTPSDTVLVDQPADGLFECRILPSRSWFSAIQIEADSDGMPGNVDIALSKVSLECGVRPDKLGLKSAQRTF